MGSTDIDGSPLVILGETHARLVLAMAARSDVLYAPESALIENIKRDLQPTPTPEQTFGERATQEVSTWPAWKQEALGGKAAEHHVSPNGAEPGSVVHDAEAWLLKEGLKIPNKYRHPWLYQGMLDDYSDNKR
jgi:hypothetical protein